MSSESIQLAKEILARQPEQRPEVVHLKELTDRFAAAEGIKRQGDADICLFEKMYGREPTGSEVTKVRFWRTGRHLPSSREQTMLLAKGLGLDEEETNWLLQSACERSNKVFETAEDRADPEYGKRIEAIEEMKAGYLARIPRARLAALNVSEERLPIRIRHLFCMDACDCTVYGGNPELPESRPSLGIRFASEFSRICKLKGEIPRQTMLRTIVILSLPDISREMVDARLAALGYLPLTEGHTSVKNALVDDLLIGLLDLYRRDCAGMEPDESRRYLLRQMQELDRYLAKTGHQEYRFMVFRSLAAIAEENESSKN